MKKKTMEEREPVKEATTLEELRPVIESAFNSFEKDAFGTTKAGWARARKVAMGIRELMKIYKKMTLAQAGSSEG